MSLELSNRWTVQKDLCKGSMDGGWINEWMIEWMNDNMDDGSLDSNWVQVSSILGRYFKQIISNML